MRGESELASAKS